MVSGLGAAAVPAYKSQALCMLVRYLATLVPRCCAAYTRVTYRQFLRAPYLHLPRMCPAADLICHHHDGHGTSQRHTIMMTASA